MSEHSHGFFAVAFEDALPPKELGLLFPEAKGPPHERRAALYQGEVFAFAFGAPLPNS